MSRLTRHPQTRRTASRTAYAARGQNDLALIAEQKCLDLLPADKINDQFKAALRQAAEQKIAKLKAKASGQPPSRR